MCAEREGYTRYDDDLPQCFKEKQPESDFQIEEKIIQKAIDECYRLYGYGVYGPTEEKLRELGPADLVQN